MKQIITTIAAAVMLSSAAMADDVMQVQLKSGDVVNYNVTEVSKVLFIHEDPQPEYKFTITPAKGDAVGYESIPSVLRVKPASAGEGYGFAFGTVAGTETDALVMGDYGVWFTVSASKYKSVVNFPEDAASSTFKLIKYDDAQAVDVQESVTSGSIVTGETRGGDVVITIDLTLSDGTKVYADWQGKPTDVTDLSGMIPAKRYDNELYWYSGDGALKANPKLSAMTVTKNSSGYYEAKFTPENGYSSTPTIIFGASVVNAGTIDLATFTSDLVEIKYSSMSIATNYAGDSSAPYKNHFLEASISVKHDDATDKWTIFFDGINKYSSPWGVNGGDSYHLIVNFAQ